MLHHYSFYYLKWIINHSVNHFFLNLDISSTLHPLFETLLCSKSCPTSCTVYMKTSKAIFLYFKNTLPPLFHLYYSFILILRMFYSTCNTYNTLSMATMDPSVGRYAHTIYTTLVITFFGNKNKTVKVSGLRVKLMLFNDFFCIITKVTFRIFVTFPINIVVVAIIIASLSKST